MAKARKSTQPASGLSAQVHRALREGALYVFGALAFILWFALFTYDPADPGFSQATAGTEVQNGVGRVGALVADLLFNFFGRPAYLFTVMVFYLGWMLYRLCPGLIEQAVLFARAHKLAVFKKFS